MTTTLRQIADLRRIAGLALGLIVSSSAWADACCLPDGTCTDTTLFFCTLSGGTFFPGITCADEPDCAAAGQSRCCFLDGTCTDDDFMACLSVNGVHFENSTCAEGCPPIGACCIDATTCYLSDEASCVAAGNSFAGGSVACSVASCASGACCVPGGCDDVESEADCAALDGVYAGDGVYCEDAPACPGSGACCRPDGTCDTAFEADCQAGGGYYEGDDATCVPTECPPGCCLPDMTCVTLPEVDRAAAGGDSRAGDFHWWCDGPCGPDLVRWHQRIDETDLSQPDLVQLDQVASIGDVDGDGVPDLAVAARFQSGEGRVWIVFMNDDGTARESQAIGTGLGGFPLVLEPDGWFGSELASVGDLDGDGREELAVFAVNGAHTNETITILFLEADGTVASAHRIGSDEGGFAGDVAGTYFGQAIVALGDRDGNGKLEIAVGAPGAEFFGPASGVSSGIIWFLELDTDGTVLTQLSQTVEDVYGPDSGVVSMGAELAVVGDLDGNDHDDLSVGVDFSAIQLFLLDADSSVISIMQPLADEIGEIHAVAGDLDGNGTVDLVVGGEDANSNCIDSGMCHLVLLESDGSVLATYQISQTRGYFEGDLGCSDDFGFDVDAVGDIDGDGAPELAVSAPGDDEGQGVVWIISLVNLGAPPVGDLDGDGMVGFGDLLIVLSAWGPCPGCPADLDGDDIVGFSDLLLLLANWS